MDNSAQTEDNYIVVECPHCQLMMFMYKSEINCQIFRHGVKKELNGQCQIESPFSQLPPHETKENCDKSVDIIYGCGKPFKIEKTNDAYNAVKCDYV